jgi:hypothetical protein
MSVSKTVLSANDQTITKASCQAVLLASYPETRRSGYGIYLSSKCPKYKQQSVRIEYDIADGVRRGRCVMFI